MADDLSLPEQDPKLRFITGTESLHAIARALKGIANCSIASLKRRSTEEGWLDLRQKFRDQASGLAVAKESAKDSADAKPAGSDATDATDARPAETASAADAKRDTSDGPRDHAERVADKLAEKVAEEMAPEKASYFRALGAFQVELLDTAKVINNEAHMIALANRIQVEVKKPSEEGYEGDGEDPELVVNLGETGTARAKSSAANMHAVAASTFSLLAKGDVGVLAEKALTDLKIARMKSDGTMPPERVKHEFEGEFREFLKVMQSRMDPDEFNTLLRHFDAVSEGAEERGRGVPH